MRIATWNVNSIKQRVGHLVGFLDEAKPDVVCLQELKCQDEGFPRAEIEAAGYAVETLGQKAYNGVALLVRAPLAMTEVRRGLPGDTETDEQARYIEALISGSRHGGRSASPRSTCRTAIRRRTARNTPTSSPSWSACGSMRAR